MKRQCPDSLFFFSMDIVATDTLTCLSTVHQGPIDLATAPLDKTRLESVSSFRRKFIVSRPIELGGGGEHQRTAQ
ncbi:hypothetical protein L1D13_09025 [Vibrio tubiashii]|uniref:hypothetical protein n=1 Tax=Vibrio tubiashii TaxID=29498 RepID=UPI001EFEBB5D|nr:hypothetical protein [Vibrio tubiashii]MCG9583660.1 hypothetical protein [Vibrio tubiashii]MCG9617237.1 hypothetical protein [Vibrio tubiashii]MCG9687066.1 hypothetical protein [Vibrio tubiashii]